MVKWPKKRKKHAWCLRKLHGCIMDVWQHTVWCFATAPWEYCGNCPLTPLAVRRISIPFACRAIAPASHGLRTPSLPTAGVSELAPMLKHRCGPHFCIWCGPASATAPAMVFHSFPAMGIVCDHCDGQLNDHKWSINSCKTYTRRPFRSMQHHRASKLSRHLAVSPEHAQMIAEFLYPSWWSFGCHEYAPSDIHGFDGIERYFDDRSDIPRPVIFLDVTERMMH